MDRIEAACALMDGFAARTGVGTSRAQERYLWTDAFAVCNFLGLARATGRRHYDELAFTLVHDVHFRLGRHRDDDERRGWLSGLGEKEGAMHPTTGGLRIGKPYAERPRDDPFDDELEWERDGQYFHYLTKWMHALDRVTRSTGDPVFNLWARELAETAHRAFVYTLPRSTEKRLHWKMSIDLTRPLVGSMGQHDALDGFLTCVELEATASEVGARSGPLLAGVITDFSELVDRRALETDDPLGLGGLLFDARRARDLCERGALPRDDGLAESLFDAARGGLRRYLSDGHFRLSADRRLAFRELGLAIGIRAAGPTELVPLADEIESFWLNPENRTSRLWREHDDIDEVMLATALAPEGFIGGSVIASRSGPRARPDDELRPVRAR